MPVPLASSAADQSNGRLHLPPERTRARRACVVRCAVAASAVVFALLETAAWPDPAECLAPQIFRIALPLGVGLWACTALHLAGAWLCAGRNRIGASVVLLAAAHFTAGMALQRVLRWEAGGDRWHAAHLHGPWALVDSPAGDGEALLRRFPFVR